MPYSMIKIEDTVRIPPELFSANLNEVIEESVHQTFEGRIRRSYGVVVLATNIKPVGEGVVIHGDGAVYQKVRFDALIFKPDLQEIIDGIVYEVVEFGAFCHVGAMDALVHMSQITNDYIEIDVENERLVGKESKQALTVGDTVRARIVSVSMSEVSARDSKIGLTMRQPALGSHEWVRESRMAPKEKTEKEVKKKKKKKKGKR